MASLSTDAQGGRTIQFTDRRRKRKTIRLGQVPLKDARAIKLRVEQLIAATLAGTSIDPDAARWLKGISKQLREKLVKVGLAHAQESAALGPFLERYASARVDVKPATQLVWGLVRANLLEFFPAVKLVRDITPGDADAFKLFLVGQSLASTTIHKRLQFCRTFFRSMLRQRLIDENPFEDVKATAVVDPDRVYFVPRGDIARVLDACPDDEWRLFVALARYGGLRCPSEHLALKWEDVDLPGGRMTVHSPKTEHHAGKASRVVPIFPELRPYLEAAWDEAPEGAVYVIHKHRRERAGKHPWRPASNYRTRFEKIIKRAGLTAWPKLFQNMRASRETELSHVYPLHIVTAWMGNTPKIALDHYLQVTESDYQRAAAGGEALQKALQPTTAAAGLGLPNEEGTDPDVFQSQSLAACVTKTDINLMEDRGLEGLDGRSSHVSTLRKGPPSSAVKSAAFGPDFDPELQRVVDAWPRLPADARATIIALVEPQENTLDF